MFFSQDILTKKGGSLGIVWVAANATPSVRCLSLSRRDYCSVRIGKVCEEVISPRQPMALRLSANLMIGILRVYRQQTHYIYVESKDVLQRLKHAFEKSRPTTDLPAGHTRSDAVTLPDPTAQAPLNATFPGEDYSFSLDSLVMTGFLSLSDMFPEVTGFTETPDKHARPAGGKVGSSPYTVDPRDISMEEDAEAPLEIIQIEVPGEGDFGDGVLVDNGPLPTLNWSGDSVAGGVGDYSSDSAGMGGRGERVEEGEEREAEEQGELDSVLLFDECTDSFQLFNGKKDERAPEAQGTPVLQPVLDTNAAPEAQGTPVLQPVLDTNAAPEAQGTPVLQPVLPSLAPRGRVGCRVRRRLAFDAEIKCKSSIIKDNMANVQTTLRDKHTLCHPLPARVKPALLLFQPVCVASPRLLASWYRHQTQSDVDGEHPEFELDALPKPGSGAVGGLPPPNHATPKARPESVASILSEKEVAREYSGVSSLGASALELPRTADDKSMDSHHTTGLTATLSDVSSFASTHYHSSLGFETSSAQRQTLRPGRIPLPNMGGLSPIADVETEASFNTQHGDLGFPDLDVSYGSSATPSATPGPPAGQQGGGRGVGYNSPFIESEPMAYFGRVSRVMGGRLEVGFQELLPHNSSRRTACRALSHVLELINKKILTAAQDQPYGTITLSRGDCF